MLRVALAVALAAAAAPAAWAANVEVGHVYRLSDFNFGSPVCPRSDLLTERNVGCPIVSGGPRVTVLAKGLQQITWGMDLTPVEIVVHVPGQTPVVGWTNEMFLTN